MSDLWLLLPCSAVAIGVARPCVRHNFISCATSARVVTHIICFFLFARCTGGFLRVTTLPSRANDCIQRSCPQTALYWRSLVASLAQITFW
jgi:hypothetical protein